MRRSLKKDSCASTANTPPNFKTFTALLYESGNNFYCLHSVLEPVHFWYWLLQPWPSGSFHHLVFLPQSQIPLYQEGRSWTFHDWSWWSPQFWLKIPVVSTFEEESSAVSIHPQENLTSLFCILGWRNICLLLWNCLPRHMQLLKSWGGDEVWCMCQLSSDMSKVFH